MRRLSKPGLLSSFLLLLGASELLGQTTGPNVQVAASASAQPPSQALSVAMARVKDAESATLLTAEGQALFQADDQKLTAYAYCSQAINLAERGEFRSAIRAAAKALFLGVAAGNDDFIAHAKRDLAMAYLYAGDLDSAQRFASEALGHYARPDNRRAVQSVAYKILGDVALRRGDPKKAIVLYKDSVGIAQGGLRFFSSAALASAYISAGELDNARSAIEKAESSLGALPPDRQDAAKILTLRIRGNLALKENQPDKAVELFTAALPGVAGPDFAYEHFWILEGLARANAAKGDLQASLASYLQAIAEAEKVRSRFRSEEIKSGLFGEMQDVFDKTVQLLMQTQQPGKAWEASESSRSRALLDLLRSRIELTAGSAVIASGAKASVSSTEIASRLRPSERIIAYHVLEDETYAWSIRKTGTQSATIPVGRRALALMVGQYRDAILNTHPSARDIGKKLNDLLIKPFPMAANESITLIPHDSLHYLPFATLWDGKQFLIQTASLSYVPSGAAFLELSTRKPRNIGRLFALANPDLGNPALALPGAQSEVEALRGFFPQAQAYFQGDATRDRFVQAAGQSQFVHIAAHGTVDKIDPLYSKLYLAPSPGNSGVFEARDAYSLKLEGTTLITLSACETGLGRVSRGDEVWGFTRSFLGAGASSLIVSLWPVSDESTELLMKKLYSELRQVKDKGEALRMAAVSVLADSRYSDPYYWGPFVLVGYSR